MTGSPSSPPALPPAPASAASAAAAAGMVSSPYLPGYLLGDMPTASPSTVRIVSYAHWFSLHRSLARSCGGLVVSVSNYEAGLDPRRSDFFLGSDVADSERSESRGSYSSALKLPAVKSS